MGLIDLRRFRCICYIDDGKPAVHVEQVAPGEDLMVRLADFVRINALASPLRHSVSYRVWQSELRLILSFLSDGANQPFRLRHKDFQGAGGHIKRFITESFGMGMLTAAVESYFGWHKDARSLHHFDVLPTGLKGIYPSTGVRPDLLFDFNEEGNPWRLAGEARGRSSVRPRYYSDSSGPTKRLRELFRWSVCNDSHRFTMTWAYTGSDRVQVDLFEVEVPGDLTPLEVAYLLKDEPDESEDILPTGISDERRDISLSPYARELTEARARSAITELYEDAPEPGGDQELLGTRLRGDWVSADLAGEKRTHLLLGILDTPLSAEQLTSVRHSSRRGTAAERDSEPIQVEVMDRIVVAVARDMPSAPDWRTVTESIM